MPREWLKELRIKANKTVDHIADYVGITRQYYYYIESGERGVPVPTAKKIAEALGFDWTKFYEEASDSAR